MIDRCLLRMIDLMGMVEAENQRQIKKWGVQDREPFEWLTYTAGELGELAKAISENHYRDGSPEQVVKEAIHTATLALKIGEMFLELERRK